VSALSEHVARRAAERTVAPRQAAYLEEVRRVVEATFSLIERTGKLNPSLREILSATGLSTQAFYRYFDSKDELFLVLLDDGRRQLEAYLTARMARATSPADQVRQWVEGVLAQGREQRAAARTRPFLADEGHLAQRFPSEHAASITRLTDLLLDPIAQLAPSGARAEIERARAVYDLTFGALRRTVDRAARTEVDSELLVAFSLALIAAAPPAGRASQAAKGGEWAGG
jgi:AcrR family transcriptional regulator